MGVCGGVCYVSLSLLLMSPYRRVLCIPWTQKVTNIEVLARMRKEKELLPMLKKRKLQYLGHALCSEKCKILHVILEGKIVGKYSIGR